MLLFTIPHAGGSSLAYTKWRTFLSEDIVLYPLELPGHMSRAKEPLSTDFSEVLSDLSEQVIRVVTQKPDEPYAVYGHSMGSLLAYYMYFYLQEHQVRLPIHLFFSGRWPPYIRMPMDDIDLDDELGFQEIAMSKGGIHRSISDNKELLHYYVELIRADFRLMKNRTMEDKPRLIDVDFSVLWGTEDDDMDYTSLAEWKSAAGAGISFYQINGTHLFTTENPRDTVAAIHKAIGR
ncbi:MAG: thioesterase [Clostridiales bacterium]|nr:thioesterase [Clostridiales bacterium]